MSQAKILPSVRGREQWQIDNDVDRLGMGDARQLRRDIKEARAKAEEDERRYQMIEQSLAGALGEERTVKFEGGDDEGDRCSALHVVDGLTYFCSKRPEHDNIMHIDSMGRTWQ